MIEKMNCIAFLLELKWTIPRCVVPAAKIAALVTQIVLDVRLQILCQNLAPAIEVPIYSDPVTAVLIERASHAGARCAVQLSIEVHAVGRSRLTIARDIAEACARLG